MAFPDASLNTQLEGGDSGVQNLFVYGKLNYNFDNEDLKVKFRTTLEFFNGISNYYFVC